ncbi:uncharacterized protein SAPINGB_P001984 [Magnusiomyces paraingens]|uniref:ZZ-type domain-containing protein n=1 Tax=Magnusiomyces paraingens TaxID=2606893 RepID=A0A5E8BC60_9ASCO|nr:uncharacterized protein SAPINGB_P001984 [Saprochaete ingens]VVT48855.1 unnamed protein product [Saprochaete ingens]
MVLHGAPLPPTYSRNETCAACHLPITGDQLKCQNCPNLSFCYPCYDSEASRRHTYEHNFVRYVLDAQTGQRYPAHQADCDVCQKPITTSFYMCKPCLDYGVCEPCFKNSAEVLKHRKTHYFYKIDDFTSLKLQADQIILPKHNFVCDGVNCRGKNKHIVGNMYLCEVCTDFGLCEACELSPLNDHNVTHVVRKFRHPMSQKDFESTKQKIATREGLGVYSDASQKAMVALMRSKINTTNAFRLV